MAPAPSEYVTTLRRLIFTAPSIRPGALREAAHRDFSMFSRRLVFMALTKPCVTAKSCTAVRWARHRRTADGQRCYAHTTMLPSPVHDRHAWCASIHGWYGRRLSTPRVHTSRVWTPAIDSTRP